MSGLTLDCHEHLLKVTPHFQGNAFATLGIGRPARESQAEGNEGNGKGLDPDVAE